MSQQVKEQWKFRHSLHNRLKITLYQHILNDPSSCQAARILAGLQLAEIQTERATVELAHWLVQNPQPIDKNALYPSSTHLPDNAPFPAFGMTEVEKYLAQSKALRPPPPQNQAASSPAQ
jgi:hypothetical protein